eukprot:g19149.t1
MLCQHRDKKKARARGNNNGSSSGGNGSSSGGNGSSTASTTHSGAGPTEASTSSPPTPAASAAIAMDTLPTVVLSHIASFARGSLSGACRSTLEAIPELHYKISIKDLARSFSATEDPTGALSSRHMGLQPSGVLATGRVVTQATVTGCTDYKNTNGGYQVLEKAVQRVVQHSIPTLQSIAVTGNRGKDSGRVAAIVGVLVPNTAKRHRIAPRLTQVKIRDGANGIVKVGKAIAAGLWPALEELDMTNCHGNNKHFSGLSKALRLGCAPNLRVLIWDNQVCSKDGVDDLILGGLSAGKCPRIERMSFTDNFWLSELRIDNLRSALHACPNLRELRMDCTRSPGKQMRDLAAALQAGDMPRLRSLFVRKSGYRAVAPCTDQDINALKKAAAVRAPPIDLEVKSGGGL